MFIKSLIIVSINHRIDRRSLKTYIKNHKQTSRYKWIHRVPRSCGDDPEIFGTTIFSPCGVPRSCGDEPVWQHIADVILDGVPGVIYYSGISSPPYQSVQKKPNADAASLRLYENIVGKVIQKGIHRSTQLIALDGCRLLQDGTYVSFLSAEISAQRQLTLYLWSDRNSTIAQLRLNLE